MCTEQKRDRCKMYSSLNQSLVLCTTCALFTNQKVQYYTTRHEKRHTRLLYHYRDVVCWPQSWPAKFFANSPVRLACTRICLKIRAWTSTSGVKIARSGSVMRGARAKITTRKSFRAGPHTHTWIKLQIPLMIAQRNIRMKPIRTTRKW